MANDDWAVTLPIDHTKISQVPGAIRDVTSSAKIIFSKEHVVPSTDNAGGQHVKGSARVYMDGALPSVDVEGNDLATGADTSDNGRLACLTNVSTDVGKNSIYVYAATSAGVSTGWQRITANRVYLTDAQECNGNAIDGIPYATQATQPIGYRQLDTTFFSFSNPSTTSITQIKCGTGIETSHADGLRIKITPLAYAGEESVTLPNGLILKFGKVASPTGDPGGTKATSAVSFAAAFPNGILTASATLVDDGAINIAISITSVAVTGFTVNLRELVTGTSVCDGVYWFAVGY